MESQDVRSAFFTGSLGVNQYRLPQSVIGKGYGIVGGGRSGVRVKEGCRSSIITSTPHPGDSKLTTGQPYCRTKIKSYVFHCASFIKKAAG
jgi:hypothetical protein